MAGRTSIGYLTSEGFACFEIIVAVRNLLTSREMPALDKKRPTRDRGPV